VTEGHAQPGGNMQKILISHLTLLLVSLLSLMLILLISCNNSEIESSKLSHQRTLTVDNGPKMPAVMAEIDIGPISPAEPPVTSSFVDFENFTDPIVIEPPLIITEPIFIEPLPPPIPIAPITTPWVFAQSPFDAFDDPFVDPVQANYVGSYGVLPTRFQDHGPFLYSFDVREDDDDFRNDDDDR
jgi:hypothetical protein